MPPVLQSGPVEAVLLPHPPRAPATPVARAWLADRLGLAPGALALARDAHGRPVLAVPGLDCNWSHSGDRLLVALGRGVQVGVDIELPHPRPRALELARRFFHADEAAALAALGPSDREAAFLALWCAKEAVLKAHGRGLAFGLDRLRFEHAGDGWRLAATDPALGAPEGWTVHAIELPGAVAALAWRDA